MYNMDLNALQINVLSEEMQKKLPPTDGRFRSDMRSWDQANLELATKEKLRLELNQKARREQVKALLETDPNKQKDWDINDERTFYRPNFFNKTFEYNEEGKKEYIYMPKKVDESGNYLYWEWRDKAHEAGWNLPRIFDDDCKAFYDVQEDEAAAQKAYNESQFQVSGADTATFE